TSSLGCLSAQPRTISIVVNATPNIIFSPASPTVCFGRTVTVNAIGGTSYTWFPGSLVGNSQQLSPTVTTVYTVQGANAFNCVSTGTVQVNVLPIPTVTTLATPTLICSGSSATLSAGGATTFTWMPGSVIASSFAATPSVTTNYTVTGAL